MNPRPAVAVSCLWSWLCAPPAVAAQEPAPAAAPTAQRPAKLAEWPELKPLDRDRAMGLLGQFAKDDPALRDQAHAALVAMGDATAPLLFLQLDDRAGPTDERNKKICKVLDEVLDQRHGALLARECRKPKVVLRRYAVLRMCTFLDPELAPALQAASKDKDEEVRLLASLGLLSLKHQEGLGPVLERARKDWASLRELAAKTLPNARSPEACQWVLDAIAKTGPLEMAAGLRLLRSLAPRELAGMIKPRLDAEDHNVKKEAVNAMRAIHGEEPIENMSVFQAIEMAKAWKARA